MTSVSTVDAFGEAVADSGGKPSGLAGNAWRELRRRPLFIVSLIIILFVIVMAAFPWAFTQTDPTIGNLSKAQLEPNARAWFGYDVQGRDVFARVVHGARASLLVGFGATLLQVVFGSLVGIVAGYFGRWADALLSRLGDIFFGLPFLLGAIVVLTVLNPPQSTPSSARIILQVILAIALLSWPVAFRIMRSSTLSAKQQDFVKAARSLGASTTRIIFRHLLPNSVAPVMVYATIALGANIGAEATLSYLGIGLQPPVVSWGVMISDSTQYVLTAPHMLLFPAGFVVLTVLAFSMLGDAVRDALDPKSS